ncbi:MAG: aggregation factor core [Roseobacter sp.]
MRVAALTVLLAYFATTAPAQLAVRFVEGAPKDRFIFENTGDCGLKDAAITVDLAGSNGRLIFDVTGQGAGVSVFQPFEVVSGLASLSGLPIVKDGDTLLSLSVNELAPGDAIAFTIDVDDTVGQRETVVAGAEVTGADVIVTTQGEQTSGVFGPNASAVVPLPPCPNA